MAVAAVLAEAHFAKQEITQGIDAISLRHIQRIDDIAQRLRHFFPAPGEDEAVTEDLSGQRKGGRHQESRPIDRMEADNVLADQMDVRRPETRKLTFPLGK